MASKSLGKTSEGEGAAGKPSSEEEEHRDKSVDLKKSESRILREQGTREDINSTRALVAAYNQAETEEELKSLHQWLQRYTTYLDAGFTRHADDGIFEEMSCLAGIKPCYEEDKKLIKKTIFFLGQQVSDITFDQRKIMAALAAALQAVDESVFDGDASTLLKLSNVLLNELNADQTAFVAATHSTHSMTLFALHQLLLVVHGIAQQVEEVSRKQQWFQTFETKLRDISECQSDLSSLFQVKMVEQCLERFVIDSPSNLRDVPRRMMSIFSGCCYLYTGIRKALAADIDLDSLMAGCKKLREVTASKKHVREWYDEFLTLNAAVLLSSQSTDSDCDFMSCLQEAMKAQTNLSRCEDASLLRFGIVTQLSYVVLHGKSSALCQQAMTELVYIAARYLTYEDWDSETAIIETVLSALQDVYLSGYFEEMVETAVLCMKSSESETVRETIKNWLNGQTIEDKLRRQTKPRNKTLECLYLFKVVRKDAGLYSYREKINVVDELRSMYQAPEFSKIPGLVEEQTKKDVTEL